MTDVAYAVSTRHELTIIIQFKLSDLWVSTLACSDAVAVELEHFLSQPVQLLIVTYLPNVHD